VTIPHQRTPPIFGLEVIARNVERDMLPDIPPLTVESFQHDCCQVPREVVYGIPPSGRSPSTAGSAKMKRFFVAEKLTKRMGATRTDWELLRARFACDLRFADGVFACRWGADGAIQLVFCAVGGAAR